MFQKKLFLISITQGHGNIYHETIDVTPVHEPWTLLSNSFSRLAIFLKAKVDEWGGTVFKLPSKKYQIIYADPPWNGLGWNNGSGKKCPANHYQVQDINWIKALPVGEISDNTCFLFLWVTFPNLQEGLEVIKAWDFKYATCAFNWVKRNKKSDGYFVGCGNYTRANSELCLLGTKGRCQKARQSRSVRQVCDARILKHSQKPHEIRDRIVELCGDVPRIELFARENIDGWDVWGDGVPSEHV